MQYTINGKQYTLKEKYTLRDWGQILKLLSSIQPVEDVTKATVILLTDNKIVELLNLILSSKVEGELYEDDLPVITEILQVFFSRKNGLIKNTGSSLEG